MKVKQITFNNAELSAVTGTTKVAYIEFTKPKISVTGNYTLRQVGVTTKITNNTGAIVEVALIRESDIETFDADPSAYGRIRLNNNEVYEAKGRVFNINAKKGTGTVSSDLLIDVYHFSNPEEV